MISEYLYSKGIDIRDVKINSEEHKKIRSAAFEGDAFAQYYLGVLLEEVKKTPEAAMEWYIKAAEQGVVDAILALNRLEKELPELDDGEDSVIVLNQSGSAVINKRDFQKAKNGLSQYRKTETENMKLKKVPTKGGIFNLGSHTVKGDELNTVTSQIQNYLIDINRIEQGIIDEFGRVYDAFDALDKDYISAILTAIKAAEEVSKQEQKDRQDIKELIEKQIASVEVLKKFKKDIEALKHITDVDRAWELIGTAIEEIQAIHRELGGQSKTNYGFDLRIQELYDLQADFSDVVNKMVSDFNEEVRKELSAFAEDQTHKLSDIEARFTGVVEGVLNEQKTHIEALKESINNNIADVKKDLLSAIDNIEEKQREDFCAFAESQEAWFQQIIDDQVGKISRIHQELEEEKAEINKKLVSVKEELTSSIDDVKKKQQEDFDGFVESRDARLQQIIDDQADEFSRLHQKLDEEKEAIDNIEKKQQEDFCAFVESQEARLQQIIDDQANEFSHVHQALDEEKEKLQGQVEVLNRKLKILYVIAGGATALTVAQLLLNILGVL